MKFLLPLLFACSSFQLMAQDYRFGKVDLSDFNELSDAGDDVPVAEVLLRQEHINFIFITGKGLIQQRKIHERIKINKQEGLEYATKKIRLYNKNATKRERLRSLNGYTYRLVNNEFEKEKLTRSGEFEEELNEYWKKASFTMPNAQIGSIVEYEYSIESPFYAIDDVLLQYDVPIKKLDIEIVIPEYLTYNVHFNPMASFVPDLNKSISEDKVKKSEVDPSINHVAQNFASQQYELSNKVLTIKTSDIPALVSEPMSGALSNYRAKVVFELSKINNPSGDIKKLSSSWEAVAKTIYKNKNFGGQLDKNSFYGKDLEPILQETIGSLEKAQSIYQFVRDRVKWNGNYGIYTQNGIRESYKNGSGNVADVNLLLTSILNSEGIAAQPMLISSQDNGVPLFPTRDGFDYVAVYAVVGDNHYLLDATDGSLAFGQIPFRAANWKGRAFKEDGNSFWVDLEPSIQSTHITSNTLELREDMHIVGNSNNRLTDYQAYEFRVNQRSSTIDAVTSYIRDDKPGLVITNLELNNMEAPDKHLEFTYNIDLSNNAEVIGDKIYVTPLLNESNSDNPFKMEQRKLPVDLKFPISKKTVINLLIPKGYEVVSSPKNVQINYLDQIGTYRYLISHMENVIQVNSTFDMKGSFISPENYSAWKSFFTAIVAKDEEKIVLKKI